MPSHPEGQQEQGHGLAGVILAAGSSTRMGRNKLLLDVGGEPLVRRAVRIAIEAGLAPVIVVLGHDAEPTRAALDGLACLPVVNPDHAQGKGTSLQVGITQVSSTAAAGAVVMLADMPFVTAAMVAAIVEQKRASGAPLVVSRYGEVNAPPMLYDRSLFAELLSLPGEACGKEMVRRHRQDAAVVSWPEEALDDVDAPADYYRARGRIEGGG